ncbi:MAG: hypothetical protein ACKOW8_00365, partial [Flavobacteriales bacterium]
DSQSENINIYSIPRPLFSRWISHPEQSIAGKLKYRLALTLTKLFHSGTPYDISAGWKKRLIKKITQLHSANNYKTIIATGAPWQMLDDLANLISENKALELIVDFRDPWIESKNYGIQGLSRARLESEISKQLNVLKVAKVVFTPYNHISENLRNFSFSRGVSKEKFTTLEHFFDQDDLVTELNKSHHLNLFKIVYAGEVYDGTASMLENIVKDIQKINSELAKMSKQIELEIYTDTKLDHRFSAYSSVVVKPSIGKRIFEVIAGSDACLILLPPHKKEEKTTKFFEYLAMKKPLLVASEKGGALDYVESNQLGFAWKNGEHFKWLDFYLSGKSLRDETFDIAAHELQARARQVIKFLA